MDPTAQDRWWKKRIEKEERAYVDKVTREEDGRSSSSVMLNSLSVAQEYPSSHSRLVQKARSIALQAGSDISTGSRGFAPSAISSRVLQKLADLEGRSVSSYPRAGPQSLRSCPSYPRTPTFSAVGSKSIGADSEILLRLTRLERELEEERNRREEAQHEMAAILYRVGTPSST